MQLITQADIAKFKTLLELGLSKGEEKKIEICDFPSFSEAYNGKHNIKLSFLFSINKEEAEKALAIASDDTQEEISEEEPSEEEPAKKEGWQNELKEMLMTMFPLKHRAIGRMQ